MARPERERHERRRKPCPFLSKQLPEPHWQDVATLKKFIHQETGKIMPTRVTGVSRAYQRKLAEAIRVARHLALLPFTAG